MIIWARLVQVLAPARAAPTTDVDGLWGVVIDRSGKEVKQLFTPRNSWGMSVQRGFSAMAPAFCSLLWLYFLKQFLYPYAMNRPLIMLLFVYLCVAVVLHASLSDADIRVGLKGFPGCLIIIFLVLYIGKIYPGNLYMKYFGIDPFAIFTEVIGRI